MTAETDKVLSKGKIKFLLVSLLIPLLIVFAVYAQLVTPSLENGKKVVWLLLYVGLYLSIQYIKSKCEGVIEKREKKYAAVLAVILSFLQVLGHVMELNMGFDSGMKNHLLDLVSFAGLFFAFYYFFLFVFSALKTYNGDEDHLCRLKWTSGKRAFRYSWAIVFSCWLILLIICYPGLLTPDSLNQVGQALSGNFSDWHPVIHTWFITFFVYLGKQLHDINFGVFLYSLAQIAILSAICAYSLYYMERKRVKTGYRILVLLYYALFPINALMGITMWKDILFSGITLVLVVLLIEIADNADAFFKSYKKMAALALISFLFCVFRNNGLYAFLVFIPFLFVMQRRYWKQLLITCCSCLILVGIYKGPVFHYFHVTESPVSVALSVPVQQIARTVKEERSTLTQDETQRISEILPIDKLPELYSPGISNPVVTAFNEPVFLQNKTRYISLWFDLMKEHPKIFLESFLANNFGFWSPDLPLYVYTYQEQNDFGILPVQDSNAVQTVEKWTGNYLQETPVLSMLYSVGLYVWIFIFLFAFCIYKHQTNRLLPLFLLLTVWLTIMAGPVVEYRYAYGIVLSCPTCLGMYLFQSSRNIEPGGRNLKGKSLSGKAVKKRKELT